MELHSSWLENNIIHTITGKSFVIADNIQPTESTIFSSSFVIIIDAIIIIYNIIFNPFLNANNKRVLYVLSTFHFHRITSSFFIICSSWCKYCRYREWDKVIVGKATTAFVLVSIYFSPCDETQSWGWNVGRWRIEECVVFSLVVVKLRSA
jgi:hypothetical protein